MALSQITRRRMSWDATSNLESSVQSLHGCVGGVLSDVTDAAMASYTAGRSNSQSPVIRLGQWPRFGQPLSQTHSPSLEKRPEALLDLVGDVERKRLNRVREVDPSRGD
jgi:hypothetical protein